MPSAPRATSTTDITDTGDTSARQSRRASSRAAALLTAAAAFLLATCWACRRPATQAPLPVETTSRAIDTVPRERRLWLDMRNVDLHVDERQSLHIRDLRGEAVSNSAGAAAVLDDPTSFTLHVTSGTVELSGDAIGALLNEWVFAYPGAPLTHLRAHAAGDQLVLTGTLFKGVAMPFEISSRPTLDPDGRIRLHPSRTRILGVDGAKLLHAFGLRLDGVLDLRGSRGAAVQGDDVLLEPTKILPPPAIAGRLASIRVESGAVVQDFVRLPDDSVFAGFAHADSAAANYVYFRGGRLRFGKLLMIDTDLQIVDADERDPFDLYLKEYARQLSAGTSQTLPSQGLRVLMPDYRTVAKTSTKASTKSPAEHVDAESRQR